MHTSIFAVTAVLLVVVCQAEPGGLLDSSRRLEAAHHAAPSMTGATTSLQTGEPLRLVGGGTGTGTNRNK